MIDYHLREFADLSDATVEEGEKGGDPVIRNAVLLGPVSKNGGKGYTTRVYTAAAMRSAVTLYEGARGYFNHATAEDDELRGGGRDVRDFAGAWRNVRFDEAKTKLVGDFHIVNGPDGRQLADVAKRFPENSFGFSHDAAVAAELDEATETLNITRIRSVNSVDVVDRPATTRSFFEHQTSEDDDVTTEAVTKATEARVKAEADLVLSTAKVSTLTKENEELTEKLAKSEKVGQVKETQAIVEKLVSDCSDPIAKRVRSMFEGRAATEVQVTKAIEELEAFSKEVGGKSETPGGRRSDHRDEKGDDDREVDETVSGDSIFGDMCGIDITEQTKDTAGK